MTDSRKKLYNYAMGQITSKWQFREKKITIMREGKLLPFDRFQKKNFTIMRWGKLLPNDNFEKNKLQLCERANYYLMTDSRQKK